MRALLLVDIQVDFLPGGALAVPAGDEILPVVNRLLPRFETVIATKDWHPPDHGSFASNHPGRKIGEMVHLHGLEQILWPDHCIHDTTGAEFARGLDTESITHVFYKGTDADIDSYSAFFDNARLRSTGLDKALKAKRVDELLICGLALDYCVKYTALDAFELGFQTRVVNDATRPVDLSPGDGERALGELRKMGIDVIHSDDLLD